MNLATLARWRALAAACVLGLGLTAAQAHPLADLPFAGQGNLLVFDAATGSGGWNGEIRAVSDPATPPALSFAVLVTFDYDATANRLHGRFEFTQADDLASSVFGRVRGGFTDAAGSLDAGGQLALDYDVRGGTGRYAGTSGFALSFLSFDPRADGDANYTEHGLLVAVPEPGMAWLMAAGLLLLAPRHRRRAHKTQGRGAPLP
ncbi:MAG: hypothetical protein J0L57_21025 [Burkholderiales bacterium]|nr:hypothetical protein [Burkholderiales bacterium]